MKKYKIRVNCGCFEDIEIDAESLEEARALAELAFNCPANSPESEKDPV